MYKYEELKAKLFTDEGQRTFLAMRDRAKLLLKEAGAMTMEAAIRAGSGDSWLLLACVDRMVELGEIREIPQIGVCGQHRIFVSCG